MLIGFQAVARPAWDKNDCAIRALANATGMGYDAAASLVFDAGRVHGKGTAWRVMEPIYSRFGKLNSCRMSLSTFVRENPVGAFIVRVPGHVFAVRDGVQLDTGPNKSTSVISHYWTLHGSQAPVQVERAPKRPPAFDIERMRALVANTRFAVGSEP